jgi:hypothetical protein
MVGSAMLKRESAADLTKRILLIDVLHDFMSSEKLEVSDVEELLDDYMDGNFAIDQDEKNHEHTEIAEMLIKLRAELTQRVHDSLDLTKGPVLLELVEFNRNNLAKIDEISAAVAQAKAERIANGEDSDSSGFESLCGDSICESYNSGGEDVDMNSSDDEEFKTQGKEFNNMDDEGFETVVKRGKK